MHKFLLSILFILSVNFLQAQNFNGQWKGNFMDKSTSFMSWGGDLCDYVLELNTKGNKVTGFSYTYFNSTGKRYYTICRLEGFIKKNAKYVEVREVERTKTNVPTDIRNCFQIHRLKIHEDNKEDVLSGDWVPAPDQDGDCGFGNTILKRRVLKTVNKPLFNNATTRADKPKIPETKITIKPKPIPPPIVKNTTPIKPKEQSIIKQDVVTEKPLFPKKEVAPKKEVQNTNFEKRDNSVIQTIEVENETFKVDFYDNGDIDGDTISVFFNGKLVEARKRLSDKALSLNLVVDPNIIVNELIMYAENLGSIPPNTAVMIVTDGGKRYEVRIASDLKKSGVIRFVHKLK